MKKILILIMFLLMPISTVLAYSTEVILGGQNIGIEVKTKGVLVIGLYKINDEYIAKESGITSGDYIVKVNSNEIKDIDDFTNQINLDEDKESIDITYKRDNKYYDTNLVLYNDNGEYKTGLYVRDTINGIGTLTMIDPATKKFLALGHQILDSNTKTTLDIDKGSIYYSYITGINKSNNGNIGDKQATSYVEDKRPRTAVPPSYSRDAWLYMPYPVALNQPHVQDAAQVVQVVDTHSHTWEEH